MSATETTFPSFNELRVVYGFDNAVRRWRDRHRASEAVYVERWDDDEFVAIHKEVARLRLEERNRKFPQRRSASFIYDRPDNAGFFVTPTGGRFRRPDSLGMGSPVPIDPDEDKLLLLSWQLAYWRTRARKASLEFRELKQYVEQRRRQGYRNPADLDRLAEHQTEVKRLRFQAGIYRLQREPLLPRELRPPTPEEAAAEERANEQRYRSEEQFDNRLNSIEV